MLFVNLQDVNDLAPRFSSPFGFVLIVDEDQEVGTGIATVSSNYVGSWKRVVSLSPGYQLPLTMPIVCPT